MEPLEYIVPHENAGCSVQHVLQNVFQMSRSHISRLKRREGGILLNGKSCYTTARCGEGDRVSALISDAPGTVKLEPMAMPLDIVFEDDWLIVVNKPAGVTVHPERSGLGGSVENALSAYLEEGEYCHTVSRLDRGTSGLMTVAKCGYMHERMRGILHTDSFVKEYLAVACGVPAQEHGLVDLPIGHAPGSHYRMEPREDGMPSLTEYWVKDTRGEMSLLRLIPHTGRMHQLRVHMAALGCPLAGDWLYGEESPAIDRPALHSARLVFTHPITGETVALSADVPRDMLRLWNGEAG